MEVYWEYKNKPKVDEFGISDQLVLLTDGNNLSVGYWSANTKTWEVETLLMREEKVIAYLKGVHKKN